MLHLVGVLGLHDAVRATSSSTKKQKIFRSHLLFRLMSSVPEQGLARQRLSETKLPDSFFLCQLELFLSLSPFPIFFRLLDPDSLSLSYGLWPPLLALIVAYHDVPVILDVLHVQL